MVAVARGTDARWRIVLSIGLICSTKTQVTDRDVIYEARELYHVTTDL
jgi:hypothetical protein